MHRLSNITINIFLAQGPKKRILPEELVPQSQADLQPGILTIDVVEPEPLSSYSEFLRFKIDEELAENGNAVGVINSDSLDLNTVTDYMDDLCRIIGDDRADRLPRLVLFSSDRLLQERYEYLDERNMVLLAKDLHELKVKLAKILIQIIEKAEGATLF